MHTLLSSASIRAVDVLSVSCVCLWACCLCVEVQTMCKGAQLIIKPPVFTFPLRGHLVTAASTPILAVLWFTLWRIKSLFCTEWWSFNPHAHKETKSTTVAGFVQKHGRGGGGGMLTCISFSPYLEGFLLPWLFLRSFFSSAWHFSRLSPLLLCSIWYFFRAAYVGEQAEHKHWIRSTD